MKRKTDNFNKFYNKKRNSAIKEEFRQEKKAAKKERKEAIERRFAEKRAAKGSFTPPLPARPGKPGFTAPGSPAKGPGANAPAAPAQGAPTGDRLPLNKYIAHGGICSRRDAADLIRLGKVMVNGQLVTEPGTKVAPTDLVKVNGKKVIISRNFVYILLNKPKDYITTTDDPQGRRTVLDLIRNATTERVYPVGRLDRNTSGVLLLTNDGDLSQKLAHPSHEIKKIYHVVLDKPLTRADFDKIIGGQIILEDGAAYVDAMAYEDARDKTQIGLEIHSGRNRIVRRIFEHLGYDVRGLDRVMYAGLTKKNVQRGKWRLLTEKEIRILKYLNSSIKGSPARAKDWAATPDAPDIAKPAAAKPATTKSVAAKVTAQPAATAKPVAPARPKPATFQAKAPGKKPSSIPGKRRTPQPGSAPKGRPGSKSSGGSIPAKRHASRPGGAPRSNRKPK